MKDTRTLTEGAILASLFTIILLISTYVPFVGFLTFWALPLPFIIYVVRRGLKPGFLLLVIACFLAFFVGGLPSIPAAVVFGSAGMVIGELYRRKLSGFAVLLGAGLIYTLNMLLVYIGLIFIVGENPMKAAAQMTREQIELARSALTSFGQDPGQSLEQMDKMIDQITYLAPLMIVGLGIVLALITLSLSSRVLRRLGHEVNPLPPFRTWQFPKSFLWYYIIVLVIAMVGAEEGTMMYMAILNLFPLLEIALTVQGFAFIFYYCYHKKVTKALPVLLIISAVVIAPLLHIIRILGIIDLGFDLRKRIKSQRK
ncbi:DUF2232 domain-containing protein [bacterium LRH843]|nr:DUF2232 domain-containing protein [bacterium LRH843]